MSTKDAALFGQLRIIAEYEQINYYGYFYTSFLLIDFRKISINLRDGEANLFFPKDSQVSISFSQEAMIFKKS